MTSAVHQNIALPLLRTSSTNPRKNFDKTALAELAASIGEHGVLQPILVRPLGKLDGHASHDCFEIVAGERRFRAAKIAKLAEVPATVRELTDKQVIEIQVIENVQREDLHPLEEAQGYEQLIKHHGYDAKAIAAKVGKSESYVTKRLKLCALGEKARDAFTSGKIDLQRAFLIARIPHPDIQVKALDALLRHEMTLGEAGDMIREEFMLRLKDAPFDPKDAQLCPAAGSCVNCPKRTGANPELFPDFKKEDLCTDAKCFDDKRQAHYSVARLALEAKGKKVIHGAQAKKIMPNWDGNSSLHCTGGYTALDDHSYDLGGKVKDALPADYEPVLIQHPWTGKIFEAATAQAITKAKLSRKHGGSSSKVKSKAAPKPALPDLDDTLTERLAQLIHKNAPKAFGRSWMLDLTKAVYGKLNLRDDEAVSKAFGWPASAFSRGYRSKLPSQADKLDERGLVLLMFHLVFATRWGREDVQKLFGIDEPKVRDQIIEERKQASRAAREAAKKAKGK